MYTHKPLFANRGSVTARPQFKKEDEVTEGQWTLFTFVWKSKTSFSYKKIFFLISVQIRYNLTSDECILYVEYEIDPTKKLNSCISQDSRDTCPDLTNTWGK